MAAHSPRPVIAEPSAQSAVVASTSAPDAQVEGRRPKPMHEKPCCVRTNCDAGTLSVYAEMTSLYCMAICSDPLVEYWFWLKSAMGEMSRSIAAPALRLS